MIFVAYQGKWLVISTAKNGERGLVMGTFSTADEARAFIKKPNRS